MTRLLSLIIVAVWPMFALADGSRGVGIVDWQARAPNTAEVRRANTADETPHERAWRLALENEEFQYQLEMLVYDAVITVGLPQGKLAKDAKSLAKDAKNLAKDARSIAMAMIREGKRISAASQKLHVSVVDAAKAVATFLEIFVVSQYPALSKPLAFSKIGTAFAAAYAYHRFME